ncbi:MAG: ABC transporter permease [Opitutales bacterium]
MKHFFILLRHEVRLLLLSPSSYVAAVLFLVLMAVIYWAILQGFTVEAESDLPATFFFRVFWIPVFFVVPLVTMRSIAEERRLGTLETLMTTPASSLAVVLAKFSGAYLFYCLLWSLTLAFPLITRLVAPEVAETGRLLDGATLTGGYLFIAISGILFIAVGIFTSSLTRSQLVAGMLAFALLFLVITGGQLLELLPAADSAWLSWLEAPLTYLQTFQHLEDFSRGIVDTRPFFYYLSLALLLLGLAVLTVEAKA